jgi:hypothetical protein
MSADSAIDAQDKIAKHAIAAGIAPKQMLQEFASNMPRLAAYGQQAVDIFIKLEKQAKSLGMSVQELNSIIGEQYDTFDGAAQGAGKLNAILGGNYLNSIQMMNANESERIMIIKRAVDASGLQIDSMHKFQQIAIANAMGIKDLSKLKNLLGKSTSELTMDMEKEAASQAKLEKVQAAAVDMQQKLNIIFQAFLVIIKPIVSTIQVIAMVITELNDVLGGFLVPIIIFTAAIWKFGAAWEFLKKTTTSGKLMIALTALAFVFGLIGDAVTKPKSPPLYLAIPLLALGIKFLGEVVETEIPTLLAIGASLLMIGVAVKLAASGLAELVKSFEKLNNAQLDAVSNAIAYFTLMFVGFTVALAALAYSGVGEIAVGLLLAFGGAVLMIGLGVGIAAYGISIMVDSIAKLAGSITAEAAKNIINIAGAIGILASTLTTVGIFGSIGMTMGVLSVSVALSAIISSINNINETKTVAFTNLLKTFSESLKLTGIEAISIQIATAINNISAAIDKVPESKAVNFTSTMDSINRTFSSVAQVDANKMESAKQFVDTATKYYAVQKDSKGADNDALVAAITKALSSANTGKNNTNIATQQPIIVSVEIEGKEVARALARLPLVDGNMRG